MTIGPQAMAMKALKETTQRLLANPLHHSGWTLQGFGMLRLYLRQDDLRLQVWDARYAVENNNAIHNHPWDFRSLIVAGHLTNTRFIPSVRGEIYKQVEIKPGSDGGPLGDPTPVCLQPQMMEHYFEGGTYDQKASELHVTGYENGTVTIIDRERVTEDVAVSISEPSAEWVFVKPRPAEPHEVLDICNLSLKKWFASA